MNTLERTIDRLIDKAEDMVDFCRIVCNPDTKSEALGLQKDIENLKCLLNKSKVALAEHPMATKELRAALYELRRQEVIMKLVILRSSSPIKQDHQPDTDYLVSCISPGNLCPDLNHEFLNYRHLLAPYKTVRPVDRQLRKSNGTNAQLPTNHRHHQHPRSAHPAQYSLITLPTL